MVLFAYCLFLSFTPDNIRNLSPKFYPLTVRKALTRYTTYTFSRSPDSRSVESSGPAARSKSESRSASSGSGFPVQMGKGAFTERQNRIAWEAGALTYPPSFAISASSFFRASCTFLMNSSLSPSSFAFPSSSFNSFNASSFHINAVFPSFFPSASFT